MVPYRPTLIASIAVLVGACDGLGFLGPGKFCTLELGTRFSPADTTIQVGRVVGQGPGATRILASGQRYGSVGGLQVSVRAPAR